MYIKLKHSCGFLYQPCNMRKSNKQGTQITEGRTWKKTLRHLYTHQNGISFFGTKKRKLNYENTHFPRGAKLLQSSFNTTLPCFRGKSWEKQGEAARKIKK